MRIALAFLALLLPGLAWWAWLGKRDQDPLVSLAQVIGVGLSTIVLLAELVFILGGGFSLVGILLILAGFAALAAAGMVRRGMKLPRKYRLHLLIGLILLGLVLAWRLVQARELLLPNWVDSQHHYLIIRSILEHGGLPQDLSPYLSVPLYYHYGFHALTALFSAISGLEIGESMLVLGQVLNAAISLSVYALGKSLWKDGRPAAAAALLVSFVTRMPAYYLSWGRYTLITGLVLLPLAMGLSVRMMSPRKDWRNVITLALLTAGVLLSHYFAALLLACFLVILAAVHLISKRRQIRQAFKQAAWVAAGAGLGLILAAPWLARVLRFHAAGASLQFNLPDSLGEVLSGSGNWAYIWKLMGPESNHWLLVPAGVGLLIALIRRKAVPLGVWSIILTLLALPWSVNLKPFRADHFAIVLFLPVTLWAGWLFWQAGCVLGKWLKKRWVPILLIALLVGGWVAWGYAFSSDIINSVTVLVTEADMEALDWVKANTPEGARFYINTTHWLDNAYRGVDGGGWLLPLDGRWALVPTVFYGFSSDAEQTNQLRQWGEDASDITTCSTEFWALVDEVDLDWIYIREGVGSLQPEGLAECEGISEVYTNEWVHIYRIEP